jgi:methylated-DNA-protein-cysteine methyltransferase-like protein
MQFILYMKKFFDQVYAVVEQIPYGKVISYGQIARILGRPLAAREVGWAMRHCPEHLPWQRVVMSDGSIAGGMYADIRKARLEAEGAVFLQDGRVNMQLCSTQTYAFMEQNALMIVRKTKDGDLL